MTTRIPRTFRLPRELARQLAVEAAERMTSQQAIVENALVRYLGGGNTMLDIGRYTTTYTTATGPEHTAIQLPWPTVRAILGGDHDGSPEHDEQLVDALIKAGAPAWVETAEGWTDEGGWGLIGPAYEDADDASLEWVESLEG